MSMSRKLIKQESFAHLSVDMVMTSHAIQMEFSNIKTVRHENAQIPSNNHENEHG